MNHELRVATETGLKSGASYVPRSLSCCIGTISKSCNKADGFAGTSWTVLRSFAKVFFTPYFFYNVFCVSERNAWQRCNIKTLFGVLQGHFLRPRLSFMSSLIWWLLNLGCSHPELPRDQAYTYTGKVLEHGIGGHGSDECSLMYLCVYKTLSDRNWEMAVVSYHGQTNRFSLSCMWLAYCDYPRCHRTDPDLCVFPLKFAMFHVTCSEWQMGCLHGPLGYFFFSFLE